MTSIAVQRDQAPPRKAQRTRKGRTEEPELTPQGWSDVLIAAIPTEVLAIYTAVVGIIIGTIEARDDELLLLRWILYAATTALVAAWLIAAYRRQRTSRRRTLPIAEVLAAAIAFGAWGLVMPGSPLAASLDSQWTAIWSAIIAGLGLILLGMLGTPLQEKVK